MNLLYYGDNLDVLRRHGAVLSRSQRTMLHP